MPIRKQDFLLCALQDYAFRLDEYGEPAYEPLTDIPAPVLERLLGRVVIVDPMHRLVHSVPS